MSQKKTSLAELMGSRAAGAAPEGLKLAHLPSILGDNMPELPRNPLGRHRLVRALQQRFGLNFRSLPGIQDLVKQFDTETEFEQKLGRIREIKLKRS